MCIVLGTSPCRSGPCDNAVTGPWMLTEAVFPQLLSGRDGSQTPLQIIQLYGLSNIPSASAKDSSGPLKVGYGIQYILVGNTHYH